MKNVLEQILESLLEGKVIDSATNCWNWKFGKTTAGYGEIYLWNKTWYTHRLSAIYFLNLNIEDSDSLVCHRCMNPSCFNPEHLYIGTDKTNQEDRAETITHCKWGHKFTPENTYIAMNANHPKRQCRKCKSIRQSNRYHGRMRVA